jgi:hypothetical protein
MKLGQVLPAKSSLEYLTSAKVRGLLAAVVSLRLARYWRVIGPELDAYEAERVRLVHELGERDGDEVRVRPENNAEFRQQIDAMLEEEIELVVKPFDMADFQKAGLCGEDILVLETAGLLNVDWDAIDAEEK